MYKSSLTLTVIVPTRYQVEAQVEADGNTQSNAGVRVDRRPNIPYWVSISACNRVSPIRHVFCAKSAGLRSHKGLSRKQELVLSSSEIPCLLTPSLSVLFSLWQVNLSS